MDLPCRMECFNLGGGNCYTTVHPLFWLLQSFLPLCCNDSLALEEVTIDVELRLGMGPHATVAVSSYETLHCCAP